MSVYKSQRFGAFMVVVRDKHMNVTEIKIDNTNLGIAFDAANESFYVTQNGQLIARFNEYKKASKFVWSMIPGAE